MWQDWKERQPPPPRSEVQVPHRHTVSLPLWTRGMERCGAPRLRGPLDSWNRLPMTRRTAQRHPDESCSLSEFSRWTRSSFFFLWSACPRTAEGDLEVGGSVSFSMMPCRAAARGRFRDRPEKVFLFVYLGFLLVGVVTVACKLLGMSSLAAWKGFSCVYITQLRQPFSSLPLVQPMYDSTFVFA